MADKYKKLKRQVSTDGGFTWTDLIPYEYIAGELIQRDSPDCNNIEWRTVSGYICEGNTTEMTQWVADTGYVCVGFDKYNKEKEQISYNSGISWADTGNTRAGSTLIEANSTDCGYIEPIYQWVTVSDEYACVGYDKYNKEKKQISYDSGSTWEDTGETRAGSTLIEQNSEDCGYVPPITRWVEDAGYMCVGTDKYNKEKEQQSTDGGEHWTDTGNTRAGSTLIEANSTDCGYVPPTPYSTQYLTTEALGSGDISLRRVATGSSQPLTGIQYSKNDGSWTSYTYGTTISVVSGDKIRWKATRNVNNYNERYSYFRATADYKAYGNPLSLLKSDGFVDELNTIYEYAYYKLFNNSSTLKDISGLALTATTLAERCYNLMFASCGLTSVPSNLLPATTLAESCYQQMFFNCTSLTTAPELPATTLARGCYDEMFRNCTRLTTAPAILPATTLADNCYSYMFQDCYSLTTAPSLPATTMVYMCYASMFYGCTSLTTAPSLPATTLALQCYNQMFYGCTSLTTAPAILPSTTLERECYYSMFNGCTSLTTAPVLPATTLADYCYQQMFEGCTSLTTASELPATTLTTNCYYRMFYGCTSLTTAPALPATTLAESCYSYMFEGCTSLATAPALPATTLVKYCYGWMFAYCTSLTTAPVLPATTLVYGCYINMFNGCTNLNYIKCLATDISATNCTYYWVSNVASTGTFHKDANTTWSTGVSGIPSGWTVQNA